MADLVVSEGYAAAGYEYINVDDCWLEKSRGARGELVADRERFPSGMKALSNYVSLKFKTQLTIELVFILLICFLGYRSMHAVSNSAFTRTMATTLAPGIRESSETRGTMRNSLPIGTSTM